MFGIQHHPDLTRKRGRDDEEDMHNGTLSFGEHRNKRLQCLPLRTSPTSSKRWSTPVIPLNAAPCTLTPGDSDSEEQPRSHFSPWSSSPAPMSCQPSPFGPTEPDRDMDMMDTMSPPPVPQQHIQSDQPASVNGRMPTPIQPNFASQFMNGGSSARDWRGPGPAVSHRTGVVNMGHMHAGFGSDESRSIPRTMEGTDDWHSIQNRRLPSPISEGEDSASHLGSGSLSPPGMVLDNGFPSNLTARLEQSSLNGHDHHDMGMMDVEDHSHMMSDDPVTTTIDAAPLETTSAPATPSPGRKGHIRSRHTVNSWTWQPGMKKSFSIGYRADCEKCRLKVPGHFNHIVVS
ncbi:hypothetical protein CPAR01_00327 [Colletotrichum paranaense]|uniref:Dna polymerase iii subunits gamma and tau n=4 Tax=Colletotrichum acutatum species complex TaxID=2707335 RepID=A0A9Q0B855_9PEZI|nr:uncharacterized protein CCOS01_13082 [Colletotrichum costaricense]XP_060355476.1 uncharacterized protein CPAR01_00327 [Colletotrichum paranaense]XP_060403518.1 uncharacterized protein CABS01_07270 [Colletotrichum abscissum]KAK0374376.1 hypothetical protein CLIM01_08279 [Colletotrichum limetticola]KAI3558950.1 hypothetical protein CABS02_00990 [Colletotrichum abscissum]KAK1513864.1 hypothetical protein CABS01_07270 [Colletotrichum abscissum]KAK1515884.1 hypothetical protein CCOS01_13082 [Co